MKIDLSKLKQKINKNTNSDNTESIQKLKLNTTKLESIKPQEENTDLSKTAPTQLKLGGQRNLRLSQQPVIEKINTPEKQGFSLTYTSEKQYDLDDIVSIKRRDNSNCPLILKVNLSNEYDAEIIELITILILDHYLNADKDETDPEYLSYEEIQQNYPTLINRVPDFYAVFDVYFNKYYTMYYNKVKHKRDANGNYVHALDGSISLDTIKSEIVNSYNNHYDELFNKAINTYSYSVEIANKPKVEYEIGTEQGPDDVVPDTSYLSLVAKDNSLFLAEKGEIIPGQKGVPFATVNTDSILDTKENFNLLTFEDYIELIQNQILLTEDDINTKNGLALFTSNDECLSVSPEDK